MFILRHTQVLGQGWEQQTKFLYFMVNYTSNQGKKLF